jgi:inner membrane protein
MDTFTHAIAGAAIGKLGFEKKLGRLGMLAGTLFAVFPDSDYIALCFSDRLYLKYHRSFMNSLLFFIPFSLLFAFLLIKTSGVKRFWLFFSLSAVELLCHILLDCMTSSGSMIFYPLSNHRYSTDTVFPFDLIVTALFLFPLILAFIYKNRQTRIMKIFFFLLIFYLGLCEFYHSKAITLSRNFALVSGLAYQQVAALPQPFSPFRWANFIETDKEFYQGFVDFLKDPGDVKKTSFLWSWQKSGPQYRPPSRMHYRLWKKFDDSVWLEKALDLEGVKFFYRLARFPIARSGGEVNGHHLVEFIDLRFFMAEALRPFSYQVELDEHGNVVKEGFKKM